MAPPRTAKQFSADDGHGQDLDVYWTPEMAAALESWGEGTVWQELRFLGAPLHGKIVDLACGVGKNIEDLRAVSDLEVHGFDISDLLISKAIERGIPETFLSVRDACNTGYADQQFDYAYSIGSLEHFPEAELHQALEEVRRITRSASFHMVPVSVSDQDEGWIKTKQSYYCNSSAWWDAIYRAHFSDVQVIDSLWRGEFTRGQWFICRN